ncbi:MAG: hypothetical protein Q9222_002312 [Ikaeria aurantiellina]
MPKGPNVYEHAYFDQSALCDLASSLREGRSCSCDPSQIPAKGAFNWAIFIKFADGVEWVFRSPQKSYPIDSPKEGDWRVSNETCLLLLASEAATLKFIKINSKIPVPDVFAYSYTALNPIGIPYVLMSKAPGTPLKHFWDTPTQPGPAINEEQKAKVLSQLGAITWQLSRLQFDSAGSLFEEEGRFLVKQCLSAGLLMNQRDTLTSVSRGPFATELDYYMAHIEAFRQHARFLSLYPHCFFAPVPAPCEYDTAQDHQAAFRRRNDFVAVMYKTESSQNMVDLTIANNLLPDILGTWLCKNQRKGNFDTRFALHHPDLSVNNIFVDEGFNITCIIDWAFCSAVPLPVLLMMPGLPHSLDGLERTLASEFASGFLHTIMDLARSDIRDDGMQLAELLRHARPVWLFMHFISLHTLQEFGLYKELWERIGPEDDELLDYFRDKHESVDYMSLQKQWTRFDKRPAQIAKYERSHFGNDVARLVIARKLTLVSEWGERYKGPSHRRLRRNAQVFVADARLWRWIAACLPSEEDLPPKYLETDVTEVASEIIESKEDPSPLPVAAYSTGALQGPDAEAMAEKNKRRNLRKNRLWYRLFYSLFRR